MATVDPSRTSTWQANTSAMLCLEGAKTSVWRRIEMKNKPCCPSRRELALPWNANETWRHKLRPSSSLHAWDFMLLLNQLWMQDAEPKVISDHTKDVGLWRVRAAQEGEGKRDGHLAEWRPVKVSPWVNFEDQIFQKRNRPCFHPRTPAATVWLKYNYFTGQKMKFPISPVCKISLTVLHQPCRG